MGKIHFSNINSSDFDTFPTQFHLIFYTFPTRNGRILTLFQHFWRCQGGGRMGRGMGTEKNGEKMKKKCENIWWFWKIFVPLHTER